MSENPRDILSELTTGRECLSGLAGKRMEAWRSFTKIAYSEGCLDLKTRELVALGIGIAMRCKYCIVHHTYAALRAGATRQELVDIMFVNAAMGGGPALGYAETLVLDSISAFAPEFETKSDRLTN